MKRCIVAGAVSLASMSVAHSENRRAAPGLAFTTANASAPYVSVTQRAPTVNDDNTTPNCQIPGQSLWQYGGHAWTPLSCATGAAIWIETVPSGLPLDIIAASTTQPYIGFATQKISSTTMVQSAGTLSNVANTTTQTIPFLPTGAADTATVNSFAAANPHPWMTLWKDQGPQLDDMTFGIGIQTATLVPDSVIGSFGDGTNGTSSAVITLSTDGCTGICLAPKIRVTAAKNGIPTKAALTSYGYSPTGFIGPLTQTACTGTCGSTSQWNILPLNEGPAWETNGMIGNSHGMVFNSITNPRGRQHATGIFGEVANFRWNAGAVTAFFVGDFTNSASNEVLWDSPAPKGSTLYSNYYLTNEIENQVNSDANNGNGCGLSVSNEPSIVSMALNGSNSVCQSGNIIASGNIPSRAVQTGLELGTTKGSGFALRSTMAEAIWVDDTLPPKIVAEVNAENAILYDLHPQFENIYDFQGDSSCAGTGPKFGNSLGRTAATGIPPAMRPLIWRAGKVYTECVSGTSTPNLMSELAYNFKTSYNPYARQFFETIEIGPNDIRLHDTPAQTIADNLRTIVSGVRALHMQFGVPDNTVVLIVVPMEQCDIYKNTNYPDEYGQLQAFITYLRAYATLPQAQGGLGADGIVDYENASFGGKDFNVVPPFCNGPNIYTPDGEHPSDYTTQLMAQIAARAINLLVK